MSSSTTTPTLTLDEFVRRVWQAEHVIMVQNGGTRPEGWTVRVNYIDWINLVTDTQIGEPDCKVQPPKFSGQPWTVFGIPIQTDRDLTPGDIRIRTEVVA